MNILNKIKSNVKARLEVATDELDTRVADRLLAKADELTKQWNEAAEKLNRAIRKYGVTSDEYEQAKKVFNKSVSESLEAQDAYNKYINTHD